jgi:hypothetical protein
MRLQQSQERSVAVFLDQERAAVIGADHLPHTDHRLVIAIFAAAPALRFKLVPRRLYGFALLAEIIVLAANLIHPCARQADGARRPCRIARGSGRGEVALSWRS